MEGAPQELCRGGDRRGVSPREGEAVTEEARASGCGLQDLVGLLGSAGVSGWPLEDPWIIGNEENAYTSVCFEYIRKIYYARATVQNVMWHVKCF